VAQNTRDKLYAERYTEDERYIAQIFRVPIERLGLKREAGPTMASTEQFFSR
jgi:hypothetical protein